MNPTGSALVYSTYLGGNGDDVGFGVAVNAAGNAHVTGRTGSTNFPTLNPIQPAPGGGVCLGTPCWDVFVTKLNPTGSALIYSTYLGGNNDDAGFGIALDSVSRAYVTGWASSPNFPTANPFQPALQGFVNAFVAKIADLAVDQWHLKSRAEEPAGANVRAVWPTTKGTGVVIGIVDDGVQHTHPDLQLGYSSALSFDFNGNDPDPSPETAGACDTTANCHGTAVAGVATARGGDGVFGAAPLANVAGLRLTSAGMPSDPSQAAAFRHQIDAIHISNNSWGPPDDGRTLLAPGPLTQSAFDEAVTLGRGGKGRIFVWAAGNGLALHDNCNFDGWANTRFVIAVGALADNAQRAFYSEPCSAMFVTAPSNGGIRGITTTDLVGTDGYDPTDYTAKFGSTSAAAPVVSGVAALMLSRNPTLTWRDVKHILVRSSFRVNPTDPGWSVSPFPHNEKFGFGLVDAEAAVNLAATWTNVAAESAIPEVVRNVNLTIPDGDPLGVKDSITLGSELANFAVEHVQVEFTATHPYRGELTVTLTSPAGVQSNLATIRDLDSGANYSSWRFGSVRHWGEAAAGEWTLRVTDCCIQNAGTWNTWTLRIFGVGNPVPAVGSLSPSSTAAGGPGFTLTVNGSNFIAASAVRWNGADRTTTFVNSTQLQAAIPDTDIATPGTATITVFNPAPGGGTSNGLTFTIQ